ncbi:vWA domain-containing protein [Paracidovorax valerianellae]|uniref:Magnesium chelatase subunit ChlD-like protein n=1 Tax=Paracidovorax valerianellae TaxID=187868 RepID=A0A1G6MIS5_9BURK|nr:VWA domain-containing protein [Paracidovorax valerianellae]MDA8444013.1 VWA domain-containing protein [Paracidovorax valerianellae]SDC55127.1 magnesium chelatase subunit ChlD-like protein [Paracidovorax valerianellae]
MARDGDRGRGDEAPQPDPRGDQPGAWDWPRTFIARGAATVLQRDHLRRQTAQARTGRLHCFVLDCSASMVASGALARAKGVLLALMEEAYRERDDVALLCFGGDGVQLRVSPQRAPAWSDGWVAPIGGGGGTPLDRAVSHAAQVLDGARGRQGWLWLLTDGRTREQPERPASAHTACVVDFDTARLALHRAERLARQWQARYWSVSDGAASQAL